MGDALSVPIMIGRRRETETPLPSASPPCSRRPPAAVDAPRGESRPVALADFVSNHDGSPLPMDRLDAAFVGRLRDSAGGLARSPGVARRDTPPTTIGRAAPVAPVAEAVISSGCRVVAVAGAGTGATSREIISGLGQALASRGFRVATLDGPLLRTGHDERSLDSDIVVVGCRDWFPAGPVDRRRLVGEVCGCDGAILVTRTPLPCPAHARALESLGIRLLATVPGDGVGVALEASA